MKKARVSILLLFLSSLPHLLVYAVKNVGGVSGSLQTTISAGSASSPTYAVVSAGISGDAVYTGQISSRTSTTISFESSSDSSEATVNPFISGVFDSSVKTPILTASLSGAGVGSIAITYAGSGFSTIPEIAIDFPTEGDDQAFAVCTLNGSGGIASVILKNSAGTTVSTSGSGYDAAPSVKVVGGPHFVKLTESGDDDEGRVFLITDNNATRLTLDISRLTSGETLQNILQADFSVEVVPAPTLASVFGQTASDLDLNAASASWSPDGADFVYLYSGRYVPYFYMPYYSAAWPAGWYSHTNYLAGLSNDKVLYPDEGFILGKRTSGTLTLDFDGGVSSSDQKIQLPALNGAVVMNNPYGTDMILGEIIPSKAFGTSAVEFRPGSGDTDTNADQLYFLVGAEWKQFYYKNGVNDGISKTATATAKPGTAGSNGLADADISLASGTITALESCNSAGSTSVDHNVSDHTLITLNATNAPLVGFNVDLDGIFGKKLNDNGNKELDVNGTEVAAGGGISIFSGLIGNYKIIARPANNKIVVRKQRDVNFDSGKGAKSWTTGQGGTGYNGNAKAYFMGGGNTTMAVATATVSSGAVTGFDFSGTGNTRGAGYQYAPQVIISGGGWRKVGAANPNNVIQDGEILDATEGIVIIRKNPSGILTYFKPKNPFN
jgi:hypothetical protein